MEMIYYLKGDLWIRKGGTSSDYMVIGAYGSGDKPIFDGKSIILYEGTNYVRVENIKVQFTIKNTAGFSFQRPGETGVKSKFIEIILIK